MASHPPRGEGCWLLHDLNQVSLYADRVALLVEGRLTAVGKPTEVLTADKISAAYQTPVQVISHPQGDAVIVLPGRGE